MKEHPQKQYFKTKFIQLLNQYESIEILFPKLNELYEAINNSLIPAKPFNVKMIKTASIQYSVYYQASPDMSEHTIQITNTGYDAYLWAESSGWCLDYDLYSVGDIVESLVNLVPFDDFPESVQDLKWLLTKKYWILIPDHIPNFGKTVPKDTSELISWDDSYVLTGTSLENMEVLTRTEWDELCNREQRWFEE